MQKRKINSSFLKSFKIITPIVIAVLLFASLTPALRAASLSPARDLTGTWTNSISEKYYDLDPSDPATRMNDANVIYSIQITQSGSSINIILNINVLSYSTDPTYWNEYGMSGVPMVGSNQIAFSGTVSGASFSADEQYTSTGNQEHIAGTFTTDIITATLTGPNENTDTNGIIVLRSGSSATLPPVVTVSPTPTPTPAPAPPTADNLASVSPLQGSATFANSGAPVTTQSSIGTGAEIKTGSDSNTIVGFNYPDQGGTVYLGPNSDVAWVYLEPQTDPVTGNISYTAVPPPVTGSFQFSEGIEPDEFGQAGVSLAAEVGVGLVILAATGAPITLGGALVVEGTLLLGSGIAYIHEQMSPQAGTYDVRPVQVPQGLVMGAGTDYVVTVSNGSTTIQVITGSVIFVDQYTNNTVTIVANQMLSLPAGVLAGFSQQDLQAKVSAIDASTIRPWWTEITPVATATPTITATPIVSTTTATETTSFLLAPMILAAIILVIIVVVVLVLVVVLNRKKVSKQKAPSQNIPPVPAPVMSETPKTIAATTEKAAAPSNETDATQPKIAFCPECGKKIQNPKGFCPFCGSDLHQ